MRLVIRLALQPAAGVVAYARGLETLRWFVQTDRLTPSERRPVLNGLEKGTPRYSAGNH